MTAELEHALDAVVADALPTIATALVVLLATSVPIHLLVLAPPAGARMAVMAGTLSLFFWWVRAALRARPLPLRHAHSVALAFVVVLVADASLQLGLTREAMSTTDFMLIAIGAGSFITSARAMIAAVATIVAGWGAVIARAGSSTEATHFGVALVAAIALAVMIHATRVRTIGRLATLHASLADLALLDDLTGLHNRRGFEVLAMHEMRTAERAGRPLTLLYLDLDNMKQVSDAFGHEEGDRMLREVAALLRDTFRASDVVARIGGDDFCLLVGGRIPGGSEMLLARLQRTLDRRNAENGGAYPILISAGAATWLGPEDGTVAEVVARADAAMYTAKMDRLARRLIDEARTG